MLLKIVHDSAVLSMTVISTYIYLLLTAIQTKSKYMSHDERMQLQKDIQLMKDESLEKCVPSLPLKGNKYSHFYNDQEKFRPVFTL